jgi:hypothetical protein
MSDDFVWLRHVGTQDSDGHGGAWQCPAGAVEHWRAMGWEPCDDPPPEHNPVTAENVAAQQVAAEQATAEVASKPSRKGGTDTTSQE